ncbi:flagellar filament capping protein FliD [Pseudomonas sp. ZM23]|uniref:Flagellar hook-associated protein 2 n=1 Tax=Pseudomonas triclosanedens TaxID=2961893 RepID=A0ABY7A3R5_9PSED|nr:flagellar filament capping protein FliD [Pseudomonas triclosanedens]MCP8464856.1 flagellar filament capping protein FliD [Pseudomonas triclosanedens]MCP8470431.1 flagellar filament capping protein FliD [Pseudomonas triclosanedens]MCP8476237.1 flagellar filament capping protein FliD [Pseudomonas triclosanedens]WAI51530.1 flagellar filament capping protein FliD [Pseudomonas triclosanedens]
MAGITGLGSGLNIDSIVSSLVNAEKAPKQNQIDTLEKKTTTQITAIGGLKSAISTFQTALGKLNTINQFQARSFASSNNDVLKGSATEKAVAGSYQIQVEQLAAASKIALGAVPADSSSTFNSGTLKISLGDVKLDDITIDSSNNSLAGVRDAINKAGKSQGVTATIVNDAQGSRLVVSSNKTGEGKDLKIEVTDSGSGGTQSLSKLAFDPSTAPDLSKLTDAQKNNGDGGFITHAQSALLTVDGLEVKSDTNSVSTAIEGVTLDLKTKTEVDKPITVTVDLDKATVKTNIKAFVDSYNTLMSFVNAQTKVTKVGEDKAPVTGALLGDASARSLVSAVRNELVATQGDSDSKIRVLADLGITTKADGTLEVDDDKLDKAVGDNFEAVASLFTGDKGLATRLDNKLKPYTDTNGILDQRSSVLQKTLNSVDDQQDALDRRMTALQERLYKQYNTMDSLVSKLTQTTTSLTSQLASLPFAKS